MACAGKQQFGRNPCATCGNVDASDPEPMCQLYPALHVELFLLQVRLAALPLVDTFATRSKRFRTLLAARFPRFLELTVAPQPLGTPLPPPAPAAAELKHSAARLVAAWHGQFGQHYAALAAALRCEPLLSGFIPCSLNLEIDALFSGMI